MLSSVTLSPFSVMYYWVFFSLQAKKKKKKKVFLYLRHHKKKEEKKTNTGSIPPLQQWVMSLFCVNELRVCVRVWGCVGTWVCAYSICTFLRSVISLCKCYASTKGKWSISTSFVSWKSNSIFSDQDIDRVLILYPGVVKECLDVFRGILVLQFSIWTGRIEPLDSEATPEKSQWGKWNEVAQWLQVVTKTIIACPAALCHEEIPEHKQLSTLGQWTLQDLFLSLILVAETGKR